MNFLTNIFLFNVNSRISNKKNLKQKLHLLLCWMNTCPVFCQWKKMNTFFSKHIWRKGLNSLLKFTNFKKALMISWKKNAKLYKKGIPFKLLQEISLSFLEQILWVSSWIANISVITATILGKTSVSNYEINFTSPPLFMIARSGAEVSIL